MDVTLFSKQTPPRAFQMPETLTQLWIIRSLGTTNVKAKGNPIMKISPREKTRHPENIHSLSH